MTDIICDQCRREFQGQEWMMESTKTILCPECYKEQNQE